MSSNRVRIALSVLCSSLTALGLPLIAMLVVQPAEFGAFSLFYLIGASANILQLAAVSEAWARTRDSQHDDDSSWVSYSNATILMGLLGGVAALAVAAVVEDFRHLALPATIAVFAQVYRNGSRFRAFRNFAWRYVLPGDVLGALGTIGVITFLILQPNVTLFDVIVGWMVTRLAGLLGSRLPGRISPRAAWAWMQTHRRDIAVLGSDAVMGDLATIAVQFLLVPIIGLANLGVYRAVSNVGGPVRTVVFPLRPLLTRFSRGTLGSIKLPFTIVAVSTVLGMAAYLAIVLISRTDLNLGTFNSLYALAPLVGFYILAMVGDLVFSMITRQVATGSAIIRTRILVSIAAVAGPLLGAVWGSLEGALWGYIAALSFSSTVWWITVRRASQVA